MTDVASPTGYSTVGRSERRVDAIDKVTGAARYGADINLPGQLWAQFLHSPHGHARIVNIDTSEAERIPGVVKIIHAGTLGLSGRQETLDTVHGFKLSQDLFASDVVRYEGDKIACVAAVSSDIARDAVEAIRVQYELLPTIDTEVEGIDPAATAIREDAERVPAIPGSPWAHFGEWGNIAQKMEFEAGDVDAGFAEADFIVEDTCVIPRVHQTYIEPHACTARVDPSGKVTVWTSTQSIFAIRSGVASSLGLNPSDINVIGQTIGGGFGGKFGTLVHPYAVLLSQLTGRPVKIVYSREQEMLDGRPAPGATIWVRTGVRKDGTVTAREAVGLWDCGNVPGASIAATGRIIGVYGFKNIRYHTYGVYTNKPGTAAYRAPGAPQGSFASEVNLNHCAKKIGMDPVEFRLLNMVEDGEKRVSDRRPLTRVAFKETLRQVAEEARWSERSPGPDEGWGVAVGEWTNGSGPGSAVCSLGEDGLVKVFSGCVDLTGTDTAFAQIAAEVLGVPFELVRVIRGDTDSSPYATGSGGSVVLFSMGNAVKRAAESLRERLLALAAAQLEVPVERLRTSTSEVTDGRISARVSVDDSPEDGLSLTELGQMALRTTGGPLMGTGSFASEPSHPVISAQIVHVKVDRETGQITPLSVYQSLDVGLAVNPFEVEGQMEGGAIQGLSWGWMEEMQIQGGRNRNTHLSDYRTPTPMDAPHLINRYIEAPSENGPYGVKGIGEPVIVPTLAALQAAVAQATGAWITELPLTPERVYSSLQRPVEEAPRG